MAQTHTLVVREGVAFGRVGNLLLLYYRFAPTAEELRRREPMLRQHAAANPDGAAFLSLIQPGGGVLPDAASRAETTRQLALYGDRAKAGAVVIDDPSVTGTILRSFLRGVLLFRKNALPYEFFGTVPEGRAFVAHYLGKSNPSTPDRDQVERAFEHLKAEAAR